MPVTLRVALGNVSRCARDYSVYLVTLAFATCLLYSFNASGDYLLAMPLTVSQLEVIHNLLGLRGPGLCRARGLRHALHRAPALA